MVLFLICVNKIGNGETAYGDSFKICVNLRAGIILIIHPSRRYAMPKYKLSLEERLAEKARREQLTTLMSQLNINGVSDFRGLFVEYSSGCSASNRAAMASISAPVTFFNTSCRSSVQLPRFAVAIIYRLSKSIGFITFTFVMFCREHVFIKSLSTVKR